MAFLLKWLGLSADRTAVRLRPRREVEVDLDVAAAYGLCLSEIERTLGANVYVADANAGVIEAGFGVVRSERIRCTLEGIDGARTRASIEAIPPVGLEPPARSHNVDALADALAARRP